MTILKTLMGSSAALPDTAWTNSTTSHASQWGDILARQHSVPSYLGSGVEGWIKPKLASAACTGSSLCVDCGIETQPDKPKDNYEQFIVRDDTWQAAGMPLGKVNPKSFVLEGGGGCLCVGCIERRLGRQLTNPDFLWQEQLWGHRDCGWLTPRLIARLSSGMTDPRPIPEPLMNAVRGNRRLRKAKSGEINGDDVYIIFSKPGREPVAWHFVASAKARETIDTYYSDFEKFVKMVDDGAACFDLMAPREDEDEAATSPALQEGGT